MIKRLLGYVSVLVLSLGWMLPAQAAPFGQGDNFVTAAIDKVEAAVVQVNVSRNLGGDVPGALRPFLGNPQAGSSSRVLRGLGSGFVIDQNGKILTNSHVVDNADTVTVSFQDGRVLEGKVLGKDPVTDVAVIQVQAENLPTVTLGNSDEVRQGQWAIAIGNPLGLQETVTVGVISGTERSSVDIGVPDKRVGFIQTDAAINPGNSGGPLLNANGDVIGINTAIIQGTQGLGFAIPINTAQNVAQQLIATGTVTHPYIGVQLVALDPNVRDFINRAPNSRMKVEDDRGILVVGVGRGTPAAKAGLKAGDVIQAVNDQPIQNVKTIQQLVDQAGVDGSLSVNVKRSDRTVALTISPEQLPAVEAQ
ncbi:HhoA/HhoB/HtrA family serine endopeptidase [Leptolyngbya sp. FACHB-17]|uniref:HhoA/HhoB/HtrA family serine endopeptidase n=1 Tax=unclassified Leptolyngbya TaxID=2650499 RepID=UPI00168039A4|nr:HhoA/HhoB/HtrA family serine endopeptidase [Leptolyngbya sp. FACHB-17]MBD2083099.1 trypsin-like peptidase domain-containing protein [Leptolyngbya sp. FACHB-17]